MSPERRWGWAHSIVSTKPRKWLTTLAGSGTKDLSRRCRHFRATRRRHSGCRPGVFALSTSRSQAFASIRIRSRIGTRLWICLAAAFEIPKLRHDSKPRRRCALYRTASAGFRSRVIDDPGGARNPATTTAAVCGGRRRDHRKHSCIGFRFESHTYFRDVCGRTRLIDGSSS